MGESTAHRSAPRHGPLQPASTTVVILGHGSHLSPRSAEPVYDHAEALRERGGFADVRTAFWKEAPSPREVLRTVATDDVVVVPLFMAAGYFTEEVLPRELGLLDGSTVDVDGTVRYAPPVGTHDELTAVVVDRADRLTGDLDLGDGVGLAIVGHGTERNANSAAAARDHAARIRERGPFDEVRALYMDESPAIDALTDYFATDDVVVVPLFVADGHHTRVDIPEAVGLTDGGRERVDVPTAVDGRRVWYAGAVGTEPRLADVIRERALDAAAGRNHAGGPDVAASASGRPDSARAESAPGATERVPESTDAEPDSRYGRAFLRWVDGVDGRVDGDATATAGADAHASGLDGAASGETERTRRARTWGQLRITVGRDADGVRTYEVRHERDRDATAADLDRLDGPGELRERVRFDDRGEFRPLRTAPTLPTGWHLPGLDGATLVRAVETVYPATIANWYRDRAGRLDVTHFRATADRQTGRYEHLDALDRSAVETVAAACCTDGSCLKRRRWDYDDGEPLAVPRGDGSLPCREPCSVVLEAARELEADASASEVTD